jgi:FixJ family two-component response regulator
MSETVRIVHIVDDDESVLTAISGLLRANGFSVSRDKPWPVTICI